VAQATAPIKEVFDSTGWKTLALESFTIDVVDYRKEAAFYAALMGWKLREDDGKAAIMGQLHLPWRGARLLRARASRSAGPARGGAQLCLGHRQMGCAQSGGRP
jgi:hypothetical protein